MVVRDNASRRRIIFGFLWAFLSLFLGFRVEGLGFRVSFFLGPRKRIFNTITSGPQRLSQTVAGPHGKLVDNFSHESDFTSLQDLFTSRP